VKIVLGYVSTNYTNGNRALVLSDIDKYYAWYNIDGIFFDEGNTSCDSAPISTYKSYDSYIKSKGGLDTRCLTGALPALNATSPVQTSPPT
jgi:hypothetical protein